MLLMLLAVFAVSTTLLARQFLDNASGEEAYSDALAIAAGSAQAETKPTDAPAETQSSVVWTPAPVEEYDANIEKMEKIDLAALREVNGDVLGWIFIPNTKINYPLLRGEDNEYYLKHAWNRRATSVGSIFLECQNSADLMDYNTILYGHNMNDGSMFAGLKNYSTTGYWQKHPYIYVVTDSGVLRYEVFAAYKAPVDSLTYDLSFDESRSKTDFLTHALENSRIQTEIVPEMMDRILTLSTCSGGSYTNRWVVQARLKMVQVEA